MGIFSRKKPKRTGGQEGFLDCARNDETEGGLFHLKFESRNRSSSIPFLWKGNARRARGWPRERKATSQPPPLRGTSFQRKEGKQRSGIAPFILYGASIFYAPHYHPEPINLNPEPKTKSPSRSWSFFVSERLICQTVRAWCLQLLRYQ